MGAVRFQVVGKVDGVPRVVLDHVTRTHVDQMPEWPQPPEGGGCYRVEIEGEPVMKIDFTHHGEDGDHNVSGMIVTAMRLVNAVHAVCDARPDWSSPRTCRRSPAGGWCPRGLSELAGLDRVAVDELRGVQDRTATCPGGTPMATLPQLAGDDIYLTDGGLETTLVFLDGLRPAGLRRVPAPRLRRGEGSI